jgi:excinuclease ABC subunit B
VSEAIPVDVNLPYADWGIRVVFWGDEIESIETISLETGKRIATTEITAIFPANLYVAPKDRLGQIMEDIKAEMTAQEKFFISEGRTQEARRVVERTNFDLEMIKEAGLLLRYRELLPIFRPPETGHTSVLPAGLFSR